MPLITPLPSSATQNQDPTQRAVTTANRLTGNDRGGKGDLKSTFQDFVAGTFYKEMLKSLQKMHGKPAYLDGGQAEKVFQGQLDQQIAEDLAKSHGSQLSDGLYQAYLQHQRA
ncbi:MAG TPA: rod-binding protein [Planctomycetaceae bacterium]|nr:rod-binding protein [Planctomycetaceae bacterium]